MGEHRFPTKIVVVLSHQGRGTPFYGVKVIQKDDLLNHPFEFSKKQIDTMWKYDKALINFIESHETYEHGVDCGYLVAGIVTITSDDKWLIIPDPDSPAGSEHHIGIVKQDQDIDQIVKEQYMESIEETVDNGMNTRDSRGSPWILTVPPPSIPLDWTAHTTYRCIKHEYRSEFWGCAEGHDDHEPYLIDYLFGVRGHGLIRWNLGFLGRNPQKPPSLR